MKGFIAGCVCRCGSILVCRDCWKHIFLQESGLICVGGDAEFIELDPEADGGGRRTGHELGVVAAAGSGELYIGLDGIRGGGILNGAIFRTGSREAGLAVGTPDAGSYRLNRVAVGFVFLDVIIRIGKDRSVQRRFCHLHKSAAAGFPVNKVAGSLGMSSSR